ncbi:hypothetical protein LR48_Vigan10g229600 [Vigna angularis]|uniref:Uncharacterized protein n=1 Tax=Phaseolus angularis TaxID=3914 RepID=A0A0L9VNT3_PHAAN|nr:hypothetical protein LR48_Vigan10g229600 [Vigna angularis]
MTDPQTNSTETSFINESNGSLRTNDHQVDHKGSTERSGRTTLPKSSIQVAHQIDNPSLPSITPASRMVLARPAWRRRRENEQLRVLIVRPSTSLSSLQPSGLQQVTVRPSQVTVRPSTNSSSLQGSSGLRDNLECFKGPSNHPETFWRPPWGRTSIPHYIHKEPVSGASKERQLNLSVSSAQSYLLGHSASSTRPLSQIWHRRFGHSASTTRPFGLNVQPFGHSLTFQVFSQTWPHRYLTKFDINDSAIRPRSFDHSASTTRPFSLNVQPFGHRLTFHVFFQTLPHKYLAKFGINDSAIRYLPFDHSTSTFNRSVIA